jgi:hypothetical protein
MNHQFNDIGAGLDAQCLVNTSCLASEDATITSGLFTTTQGDSCTVVVPISATLTSGKFLEYKVSIQEYDGSSYDTAAVVLASTKITGASGGSTVLAAPKFDLNLQNYKQYFRVVVNQDFESDDTDTSRVGTVVVYNKKYNNA